MREHLKNNQVDEAIQLVEALLPADQADVIEELNPEYQRAVLDRLADEEIADILEELEDPEAAELAEQMDAGTLAQIADRMEPDEAADLLGDLDPRLASQILALMKEAGDVELLLDYPDETAGGLMTPHYLAFSQDTLVSQAVVAIREWEYHDEDLPFLFVTDDQGRLMGVTSLVDLIRADPSEPLSAILQEDVIKVRVDEDQEVASRLLQRYDLAALPVVDAHDRLVGMITFDDAMEALEAETTEDMYDRAALGTFGGREEARSHTMIRGSVWNVWRVRMPFLVVTLIGGMLAGAVINVFEEALQTITVLAFFIPVIMDMGGNAGSQSAIIFTRALALGHLNLQQFLVHLLREMGIGLGMGAILGSAAGVIASIWQPIPGIGLVVGISLAVTTTLATTLGFLIPYLLIKAGMDQAAGAGPVITTIKDITGLVIYFTLAYQLLGYLFD